MGLFDTVIIEGLKLKTPSELSTYLKAAGKGLPNDFQTKDLDNSMSTYYIDSKGQMYVEHYVKTGKTVKRDDFWSKWTDNRSFLERIFFRIKYRSLSSKTVRTVPELKKLKKKFTGTHTFNFYTYEEIAGRYIDLEYRAEAVGGKVKRVELIKYEIESLSAAKKRKIDREIFDTKMQESFEARKKFTSTWYYPILREIYNPFIFIAKNTVQWVCQKLVNWSYRWHGV